MPATVVGRRALRGLAIVALAFVALLASASAARADWDGDGASDLLGRQPDGTLVLYRGNGTGGFKAIPAAPVGSGWQAYDMIVPAGDFDGDGRPDIIARTSDGRLFLVRGDGIGGFLPGSPVQLATGWGVYNSIGVTDWNSDGKLDLIASKPSFLYLQRGDGNGGLSGGLLQLTNDAGDYNVVLTPGDLSGDGNADVVGREAGGVAYLLRGNGSAGLTGTRSQIATGWQVYDKLTAGDFTGDGVPDVLGRKPDGSLYLHRGGSLSTGTQIPGSWAGVNYIAMAAPKDVRNVPQPLTGRRDGYSFWERTVTDRSALSVNRADGNVLLEANDIDVPGTGLDLTLGHTYNSRSTAIGSFGRGMVGALGLDQRLTTVGGRLQYTDGSGTVYRYLALPANASGQIPYASQADDSATLTRASATGGYTLLQRDGSKSTFDSDGYLTTVSDKDGNSIRVHYATSPSKRPDQITDTHDRIFTIAYNGDGLIATITDPTNRIWTYAYDASKRMTSYTDPEGGVTMYGWDASNRMTSITSPESRLATLTYDGQGRATSVNWAGDTTGFTYGECTKPVRVGVTITDPRGKVWSYCTERGRVTRTTPPAGPVVATTFNFAGMALSSTTAGATSTNSYSASDPFLLVSSTDAAGVKTAQTYDPNHPNEVATSTDELGNETEMTYTDAPATPSSGRLNTVGADGLGTIYEYAYTASGQVDRVTTASGSLVTDYGYDAEGNLTTVAHPAPRGSNTMGYDPLSRLTSRSDAEGRTENTSYDKLDRVVEVRSDDGTAIEYDYDRDGNMVRRTLTPVSGAVQTTQWTYNTKGQLVEETRPSGSTTTYTYDAAGNLTSLTDAGGTVSYGYDDAGRLTSVTEPPVAGAPQVTQFSYDVFGNRAVMATPNGVTLSRTFNAAGRQTALSLAPTVGGSPLLSRTYGYTTPAGGSPANTVTKKVYTETNESGQTTVYDYDDPLSRFTDALVLQGSSTVGSYHYAYDRFGSISQRVVNGVTTNYVRNSAFEPTGDGTNTFTWDASGFMTGSSAGASFGYSRFGQTTSIQRAGSSSTAISYADRDQKEPTAVGGVAIGYDELGIARRGSGSDAIHYTRTPDGEVIGERTPTGRFYFARDRQASVVALTDANAAIARKLRYDPYGRTTLDTGNAPTMFGYAGGDSVAGDLVRFGARYYDAELGRWTQPDPGDRSTDVLGANPFAYADGDPINRTDATGCVPPCAQCGGGGAVPRTPWVPQKVKTKIKNAKQKVKAKIRNRPQGFWALDKCLDIMARICRTSPRYSVECYIIGSYICLALTL